LPILAETVLKEKIGDQKQIKHNFIETKEAHVWRNWRDYLADFTPRLFQ